MIAAGGVASRAALSLAQQIGLSVFGTLAATVILAGLEPEWTTRPAAPSLLQASPVPAALTSGGKFAARAEDGDAGDSFVTFTTLPLLLPMFTAPSMPALTAASVPVEANLAEAAVADGRAPAAAKPPRAAAVHHGMRHLARAPSPTRRDTAQVIAMAALPDLPDSGAEDRSVWSRSRTAYRQVAAWSGALVEHLLP